MSYNIDAFKVKKLANLQISVASLTSNGWTPDESINDDGTHCFEFGELSFVSGKVVDNILQVDGIDCTGECSGSIWYEVFEPALKESKGEFSVSCVWEGGDSINRFDAVDGVVTSTEIEI